MLLWNHAAVSGPIVRSSPESRSYVDHNRRLLVLPNVTMGSRLCDNVNVAGPSRLMRLCVYPVSTAAVGNSFRIVNSWRVVDVTTALPDFFFLLPHPTPRLVLLDNSGLSVDADFRLNSREW